MDGREADQAEESGVDSSELQLHAKSCHSRAVRANDGDQKLDVWWHVNKTGFPIAKETWEKMWKHIDDVHPDGAKLTEKIRTSEDLPRVPFPYQPTLRSFSSVKEQIEQVQRYLDALQYNHTGTQFFDIPKSRPLISLMEKAKEMISASLPIKCLEAVIVGLYLTRNIGLNRFAISFKSRMKPRTHKHVVLGLYDGFNYGAVGLSRRKTLMYKPLTFTTLINLVENYREAYANCHHELLTVKLSDVIPRDERSREEISWRYVCLRLQDGEPLSGKARQKLTAFSRELHSRTHLAQKEARLAQSPGKVHSNQMRGTSM